MISYNINFELYTIHFIVYLFKIILLGIYCEIARNLLLIIENYGYYILQTLIYFMICMWIIKICMLLVSIYLWLKYDFSDWNVITHIDFNWMC